MRAAGGRLPLRLPGLVFLCVRVNSFCVESSETGFRQNTKNRAVFASGSVFGVVFGVDEWAIMPECPDEGAVKAEFGSLDFPTFSPVFS